MISNVSNSVKFSILWGRYESWLFINKIISDQIITLNEDGNQIRDFIFLTDAAKMSILAMENLFENQTFNISSNTPTSLRSLINTISEILNKEANVDINGEYRSGDIRHIYLDNNKFRKAFDFYPKTDFKNGIIELLN